VRGLRLGFMKIAQITPGAGDTFYCENCLRDIALVTAMRNLGQDCLMIPMYLPLQLDTGQPARKSPIFFGGLNVYLQQKLDFFQKTPRWLDRLFDQPGLLRWIGRRATATRARDLAETTISMLQARQGRQEKELNRLLEWLVQDDNKPDAVSLSNILLIGLAKPVKEKLGVPVFCLLQDEDEFLDSLKPTYTQQAWQIVSQQSKFVDKFIAVSNYFADVMLKRLDCDVSRFEVVRMGILLDGYKPRQTGPEIPTIGFLSRMCPDKGLDTLVEAFIKLKKNPALKNTRLRISGGKRADDEAFINVIRHRLVTAGFIDDVDFLPDFGRAARLEFLQSLSILSVPEKKPIAYGLYVLESMAASVPVVEPAIGVFPELLELTGGGLLYEPNNADALAAAIQTLLLNSNYAQQLGNQGRGAVVEKFGIEQTAQAIMRIYQRFVK
jgi:glycosyltransferase involved in cell wall biosynthesis